MFNGITAVAVNYAEIQAVVGTIQTGREMRPPEPAPPPNSACIKATTSWLLEKHKQANRVMSKGTAT
jgi:hypothetical protein